MKKIFFCFVALSSVTYLFWSDSVLALGNPEAQLTSPPVGANSSEDKDLPWFTGPLLAGSGNTLPANHFNIEPYFFYTRAHGFFDSERNATSFDHNVHTYTPTLVMSLGLTDFMDIQAVVPYVYNHTNGQDNQNIGDSTVTLGFQLLRGETNTWRPSIRGTIGETFPIGEFEGLDPNANGTDSTGTGAYQTSLGLNFQQLWQIGSTRYFRDRLSLGYTFGATTHLQGVNAFGGNAQTRGKQKLGYQFSADLGFEYTLTDHWVPALDIMYTANGSSNFTGVTGTNPDGLPAIENGHSGDELSLAPAIEYNVNSHLGIIAGPWFSIAGRNATQFTSVVVAVNYYQ